MLNTNAAGRAAALRDRSGPQRRVLEAKLLEYDALPPELREQRLHATEFRWHLRRLLALAPTGRADQLAAIPEVYRDLIAERVARWDALPESTQRDLLAYDRALAWLAQSRVNATAQATTPAPPPPPPQLSRQLEGQLAQWRALPESRRDVLCRQFEAFFDLPRSTRERALEDLSNEERRGIESTLKAFSQLPPAQRAVCVRSFRRFAQLSPEERGGFLRTADRWREMTPEERDEWRRLVTKLPPLPPGFNTPPPLPPPLPRLPVSLADSEQKP
jgi:hypothetical protein